MVEWFTSEARQAVSLARAEAEHLDHRWTGAEHILLGLIREREGTAGSFLRGLGIGLETARRQVAGASGSCGPSTSAHPPFNADAKAVLEFSEEERQRLGHGRTGTGHLLLGIVRVCERDGEAAISQVLTGLEADPTEFRQRLIARLEQRDSGGRGKEETDPEYVTWAMEDLVEMLIQGLEDERLSEHEMSLISGYFLDCLPVARPEELSRTLGRLGARYPLLKPVHQRHTVRWPLLEVISETRAATRAAVAALEFGDALELRAREKDLVAKLQDTSPPHRGSAPDQPGRE